jgi:hypothetical protein
MSYVTEWNGLDYTLTDAAQSGGRKASSWRTDSSRRCVSPDVETSTTSLSLVRDRLRSTYYSRPVCVNLFGGRVDVLDSNTFSISPVSPGQLISISHLGQRSKKRAMIELIWKMFRHGAPLHVDSSGKITPDSALAASLFIAHLTDEVPLPKIAADGEGGLMMMWEHRSDPLLVTIDNWRVHIVVSATTPRAQYHDDIPFDGSALPAEFLASMRRW